MGDREDLFCAAITAVYSKGRNHHGLGCSAFIGAISGDVVDLLRDFFQNMSNPHNDEQEEATVVGFEAPNSPDSSYNSVYPGTEDESREPPLVPPHLHHTLLSYPASRDSSPALPLPPNVILNHLYVENRESPRSVVALGFTHRYRSKFVSVVLYKPVLKRGSGA